MPIPPVRSIDLHTTVDLRYLKFRTKISVVSLHEYDSESFSLVVCQRYYGHILKLVCLRLITALALSFAHVFQVNTHSTLQSLCSG